MRLLLFVLFRRRRWSWRRWSRRRRVRCCGGPAPRASALAPLCTGSAGTAGLPVFENCCNTELPEDAAVEFWRMGHGHRGQHEHDRAPRRGLRKECCRAARAKRRLAARTAERLPPGPLASPSFATNTTIESTDRRPKTCMRDEHKINFPAETQQTQANHD